MFSLPLIFERNLGQAGPEVKFLARANGGTLFITSSETVLVAPSISSRGGIAQSGVGADRKPNIVRLGLVNSNPEASVTGEKPLAARVNYFVGTDSRHWITNVPTVGEVVVHDAWPGIDVLYKRDPKTLDGLECVFIVREGATLSAIRLSFDGPEQARLLPSGDILIPAGGRELRFTVPRVFEETGEARIQVPASFEAVPSSSGPGPHQMQVQFRVSRHEAGSRLLIDPTLVYSTYLGGSGQANATAPGETGDVVRTIALDNQGNEYLAGSTYSSEFPFTNQGFPAGCFEDGTCFPAFVTKLDGKTGAIIFSTLIATDHGSIKGIAVDQSGEVYVAGEASPNTPTTPGAYITKCNSCSGTPFAAKLSADGNSLIYSTLLSTNGFMDSANGIAIDELGNAYVAGTINDTAFAIEINSAGTNLTYAVALASAEANAIAISSSHLIFIGGQAFDRSFPVTKNAFQRACNCSGQNRPAFVAVLDPSKGSTQASLSYATFLGGDHPSDAVNAIAVDGRGRAWVAGVAGSGKLPSSKPSFGSKKCKGCGAAFLAIIDPARKGKSSLAFSALIGGNGNDSANAIALDGGGNAYIGGQTSSTNFPVTSNAVQSSYTPCSGCAPYRGAAFLMVATPGKKQAVYSTYLGGAEVMPYSTPAQSPSVQEDAVNAIAVDGQGVAHAGGLTFASGFPISAGALEKQCKACATLGSDGFLVRINPNSSSSAAALQYATFIGGVGPRFFGDTPAGTVMDGSGNVYVAGITTSIDFPVTPSAAQGTCPGCPSPTGSNAFVAKLDPTAPPDEQLVYATYLGGSESDFATGIAVDLSGETYITGTAYSPDFPVTSNAFSPGCTNCQLFFSKLDASGSKLLYSAAFADGYATGIAIDPAGNALIGGITSSKTFPITPGALQSTCIACGSEGYYDFGGFFLKINPAASGAASLAYSTYLSGSAGKMGNGEATSDLVLGIASDSKGDAVLTGSTTSTDFPVTANAYQSHIPYPLANAGFVTVIDPTATGSSQLLYSTCFDGTNGQGGPYTWSYAVKTDAAGNIYFGGETTARDLPTSPNALIPRMPSGVLDGEGFIAELNPNAAPANQLVYGTYLGGSSSPRNDDTVTALDVDSNGRIYAVGHTFSQTFPVTADALEPTCLSCSASSNPSLGDDGFFSVLDPAGSGPNQLLYSTYLGGSRDDVATGVAIGPKGEVTVVGYSSSNDFPITSNAFQPKCPACRNALGTEPSILNFVNAGGRGLMSGDSFITVFQF